MTSQVQDPYWTETTRFILQVIGDDSPIIAPREFRPHLPKTFPYDFVHAVDVLLDYRGVAVHKGLMNELPVPVLRTLREEWKCVFANEVFLFFMPPSCSLPSTSGQHLGAFDENLALLEKKVVALQSHPNKETACVVSASRAPAALEAVLRSLSLLHLAVVVVPHTTDENLRRAFRDLCLGYRTRLESVVGHKKPAPGDAIRTGVRRVLAEDRFNWIATLDDSVVVRPDFLIAMEKWRDAETRPLLGGYWEQSDGVRESFCHDGFQCVVPCRPNARFLYGHRDYWETRFSDQPGEQKAVPPALVIPGLIIPQEKVRSTGVTQ